MSVKLTMKSAGPYLNQSSHVPHQVLPGILMVLYLFLFVKISKAACAVVLASLRSQMRSLGSLMGVTSSKTLASYIPKQVDTVLTSFDFHPRVRRYISCPKCFALHPYTRPFKEICNHQPTSDSPPCAARLLRTQTVKGGEVRRPVRSFIHQDFQQWLGRFLCRPEIEQFLADQKQLCQNRSTHPRSETVSTLLESDGMMSFQWSDRRVFYDCPSDEYRLTFILAGDGFNPRGSHGKQSVSTTGIYLFCANLPLSERQKPENVHLVGCIPGPHKPSTSEINHVMDLVAEDFVGLYRTGVRYTRTSKRVDGVLARAVLMPVLSDSIATRQFVGFTSMTSTHFCTWCYINIEDIENFNKHSWPKRDLAEHRRLSEEWMQGDAATRKHITSTYGIRGTPLFKLPYFNPILFAIVDAMHNLVLGLFKHHCRDIWGMSTSLEDGEGVYDPKKAAPNPPLPEHMEAGRQAMKMPGLEFLHVCQRDVLYYLCLENDLCRGGHRFDHMRELKKLVCVALCICIRRLIIHIGISEPPRGLTTQNKPCRPWSTGQRSYPIRFCGQFHSMYSLHYAHARR